MTHLIFQAFYLGPQQLLAIMLLLYRLKDVNLKRSKGIRNIIKTAIREVLAEYENQKPKEILSPKELAEWLGVSQAWISVNKDKLHIPYFRCGGDKFYRSDIEDWIEKNKEYVNLEREYSRPITISKVKKRMKVG